MTFDNKLQPTASLFLSKLSHQDGDDWPFSHEAVLPYSVDEQAYSPRFLFMWPNARIAVMGGEQAAGVLTTVRQGGLEAKGKSPMSEKEVEEFQKPILDKYEKEGSAYYSSARIWDDGIIEPHKTRETLGLALAVTHNKEIEKTNFGVFRM